MNRRGFLQSILAAGIAPAIVRVESLMRIVVPSTNEVLMYSGPAFEGALIDEIQEITRRAFVPKMIVQIFNQSPLLAGLIANARDDDCGGQLVIGL